MDNSKSTKIATGIYIPIYYHLYVRLCQIYEKNQFLGASWIVNWFLLAAKIFVVAESSSKAVAAALADSAVDLVSQVWPLIFLPKTH